MTEPIWIWMIVGLTIITVAAIIAFVEIGSGKPQDDKRLVARVTRLENQVADLTVVVAELERRGRLK